MYLPGNFEPKNFKTERPVSRRFSKYFVDTFETKHDQGNRNLHPSRVSEAFGLISMLQVS